MIRLRSSAPESAILTIVLKDCPDDLIETHSIKIMNNGGYEHFERIDQALDTAPGSPATYRWVMRTKIAK